MTQSSFVQVATGNGLRSRLVRLYWTPIVAADGNLIGLESPEPDSWRRFLRGPVGLLTRRLDAHQ